MTTNKVKKFFKDNRTAIIAPVVVGGTAGAVLLLGYRKGFIDASQVHAKAITEGEAFAKIVSLAHQTDKPIEFLWKFDALDEITKFAINEVK